MFTLEASSLSFKPLIFLKGWRDLNPSKLERFFFFLNHLEQISKLLKKKINYFVIYLYLLWVLFCKQIFLFISFIFFISFNHIFYFFFIFIKVTANFHIYHRTYLIINIEINQNLFTIILKNQNWLIFTISISFCN